MQTDSSKPRTSLRGTSLSFFVSKVHTFIDIGARDHNTGTDSNVVAVLERSFPVDKKVIRVCYCDFRHSSYYSINGRRVNLILSGNWVLPTGGEGPLPQREVSLLAIEVASVIELSEAFVGLFMTEG